MQSIRRVIIIFFLLSLRVLEKFYQEHVVEVDPQRKFKCKLCGKLFKGSDFVKKHIDYKHHETVEITSNDVRFFLICHLHHFVINTK